MKKVILGIILSALLIFVALRNWIIGKANCGAAYSQITAETLNQTTDIPDEIAVAIARQSFAETPLVSNPPPIIHHENAKTVVYLPRYRRQDESLRDFPKDWLPVWIDNATKEVVPSPSSTLTEAMALVIAKNAIEDISYDKSKKIEVQRNSICFVFTFPEPSHGPPGTYLGPDFAAKVAVSSETGEIKFIRLGW